MSRTNEYQAYTSCCKAPAPAELVELGLAGLCVLHYTLSVEKTCAQMHREIALHGVDGERQAEVTTYIGECAVLIAHLGSNLSLSDELKKRVLSTFLTLMNLRENLERDTSRVRPRHRGPKPSRETVPALVSDSQLVA